MSLSRAEAIAESDRRWPDFGDLESHSLSGGFLDGALWRDQNPQEDLSTQIEAVFPRSDDPYEELVAARWRRGYIQGADWAAQRTADESIDLADDSAPEITDTTEEKN